MTDQHTHTQPQEGHTMKRTLYKNDTKLHHYAPDGACVSGPHPGMWGDCSELQGDCSGLRGKLPDSRQGAGRHA